MSKKQTICSLGITIFIYFFKKIYSVFKNKSRYRIQTRDVRITGRQPFYDNLFSILMEDYNSYSAIVNVDNHILYSVSYPVKEDIFILYHFYLRTEKPHNFRL